MKKLAALAESLSSEIPQVEFLLMDQDPISRMILTYLNLEPFKLVKNPVGEYIIET